MKKRSTVVFLIPAKGAVISPHIDYYLHAAFSLKMPQPEMGSHQTYFFTYPFIFPVIFVYFFSVIYSISLCPPRPPTHTTPPPNINCLFDCSFPVSLSQKLPEFPRLPASAGVQDAPQVPIAVIFASESPSSEKHHQIPVHLL